MHRRFQDTVLKRPFLGFLFPQRWDYKPPFIMYFLSNISAKNYLNWLMWMGLIMISDSQLSCCRVWIRRSHSRKEMYFWHRNNQNWQKNDIYSHGSNTTTACFPNDALCRSLPFAYVQLKWTTMKHFTWSVSLGFLPYELFSMQLQQGFWFCFF